MSRSKPTTDLKPYFQTLEDLEGPFNWSDFFGNDNPVVLDVGTGRGLFLFNSSGANPDKNYLGLEIDYREGRRAATRLFKADRPNARVLGGDARMAFDNFIPKSSISEVHVYFPDPWWKKRHHKRRIFTDVFVRQVTTVLKQGGELHFWTDVEEYFERVKNLMDHASQFAHRDAPEEKLPEHEMDYQTSFERKKRNEGWKIHRGLWELQS
ncbi:tRNA (guanosine(46)-N7)-methyltransferase TrmB [Gimesia aquarii]|uniref:tRNA (guanine-N(7)-)-methyltransferase n=1 Tax=Gimesia aquarii TaxID=2527964 RepID=A0A517W3J0_9PLAN|nr:tRNA (guanosine(46)-N7)-methyltransferase TrmB [Gimesia aquarii]QDT99826.1 tRNA (guanine-N(7)-)-methyltransferase [Gimesia aquarii]